ncbi:MAG: hypothetical protein ABI275_07660, partial [Terrimesophilobacter sp.]
AAICLGGGLALFYLTNAVVLVRYGAAFGPVLRWAVPAVLLPIGVVVAGSSPTGIGTVAATTAIVASVIAVSAVDRWRTRRRM